MSTNNVWIQKKAGDSTIAENSVSNFVILFKPRYDIFKNMKFLDLLQVFICSRCLMSERFDYFTKYVISTLILRLLSCIINVRCILCVFFFLFYVSPLLFNQLLLFIIVSYSKISNIIIYHHKHSWFMFFASI
jgi:hypothetical protein